jgi:hypothetical protein
VDELCEEKNKYAKSGEMCLPHFRVLSSLYFTRVDIGSHKSCDPRLC